MDRTLEEDRLIASTEIKVLGGADLREIIPVGESLVVMVPPRIEIPRANGKSKVIPDNHMTWIVLEGIVGVHRDRVYADSAYKFNEGSLDDPHSLTSRITGISTMRGDYFAGTCYTGSSAQRLIDARYESIRQRSGSSNL